jgi:hypothetical protein
MSASRRAGAPSRRDGFVPAPRRRPGNAKASSYRIVPGWMHDLAFSRRVSPELCCRLAPIIIAKGRREGWAPAAPESVYKEMHTGWTTGDAGRPAFPARMVLTVSFVLSSGSVALLPPSPCGVSDARTRLGRRITASLDAQTPGVRTTRLLRPRTIWPQHPGLGVHTPDHRPNRCDRAVSYRVACDSRLPALSSRKPRRLYRVHRTPSRIS